MAVIENRDLGDENDYLDADYVVLVTGREFHTGADGIAVLPVVRQLRVYDGGWPADHAMFRAKQRCRQLHRANDQRRRRMTTLCSGSPDQLLSWFNLRTDPGHAIKDVTSISGQSLGVKQWAWPEVLGASCLACHRDWPQHSPALIDVLVQWLRDRHTDPTEVWEWDPFDGSAVNPPTAPTGVDGQLLLKLCDRYDQGED